jgi:LysM repeat protein
MNNPNPLMPQGTLQPGRPGGFNIRLVVFGVIALHAVFFAGFLIQGCKPKEPTTAGAPTNGLPPLPTPVEPTPSLPPMTNAQAPTPVLPPSPTPVTPVTPMILPGTESPSVVTPPLPLIAPPTTAETEYTVVKGDSFYVIAKKLKVSLLGIAKANPGVDSTKLKVGQKIKVPAPAPAAVRADAGVPPSTGMSPAPVDAGVYTVKSGDTLTKIAKAQKTTLKAIREANNLATDKIKVGQKLKMPGAGGTRGSVPEPAPEPSLTTGAPPASLPTPGAPAPRNP